MYNPDYMVVAATNADHFAGSRCVNAFVKDSLIVKDSHNDNRNYDYTNEKSDLPASMPMLFGISGNTAQVAPMIKNASVKDIVQAKLTYNLELLRYGKKSSSDTNPYGLNLLELADFMRFYGVYSGANFDGGGSTQLITRNFTTNEFEVTVRSSDFGTNILDNSRGVINSILVTKKYE